MTNIADAHVRIVMPTFGMRVRMVPTWILATLIPFGFLAAPLVFLVGLFALSLKAAGWVFAVYVGLSCLIGGYASLFDRWVLERGEEGFRLKRYPEWEHRHLEMQAAVGRVCPHTDVCLDMLECGAKDWMLANRRWNDAG